MRYVEDCCFEHLLQFVDCDLEAERSQLTKWNFGFDISIISNAICNPLRVAFQSYPRPEFCTTTHRAQHRGASRLFELLLGAELVGVAALLLAAVGSTRGETGLMVSMLVTFSVGSSVRIVKRASRMMYEVRCSIFDLTDDPMGSRT